MRTVLTFAALAATATLTSAQTAPLPFQLDSAFAQSGSWFYSTQPATSDAAFVDARGQARVTIRCTRTARRVSLHLPAAAGTGAVTIWTSSGVRTLAARFDQAAAQAVVDIAAGDGILDAVAFSRGRFAVSLAGSAPLVLPSAPEVGRVAEDCRS